MQKLDDYLKKDVTHKEVRARHNVAFIGDKRIKKDFKAKFEAKYNVTILESVNINKNFQPRRENGPHGRRQQ